MSARRGIHRAHAVNELLDGSHRGDVILVDAFQDVESAAELRVKLGWRVPRHGQAAAFFRTVRAESCDEHVAPDAHASDYLLDVTPPVVRIGEEVKHRAIVPHVVGGRWQFDVQDVALDPVHATPLLCQTGATLAKCGAGKIQRRNFPVLAVEQAVDQGRCPAPHVDDRGGGRRGMCRNQPKRELGFGLIPAHFSGLLLPVNGFPMRFSVHG